MGGLPLRLRGGRLVIELPKKRRSQAARLRMQVHHGKIRSGSERMEVYCPDGRRARPLLAINHRDENKLLGRKRPQQFWRVVNLFRLREPRPSGEQRMTIRDATLGGAVAGRTRRLARMNAERFYARSLPEDDFALIKAKEWRSVCHLKKWPPEEEEAENFSEDLGVCFGILAAVS